MGALEDGHEHGVHHAEHSDEGKQTELADPAPGPAGRRLGAFSTQKHGSLREFSGRGHKFVRVWRFANQAGLGRREAAYQ